MLDTVSDTAYGAEAMLSSLVPRTWRLPVRSSPNLSSSGTGQVPDRPLVRVCGRPEIDRLVWDDHDPPSPPPGQVGSRPCAVAARSSLFVGTTRDGTPAWVREPRAGTFTGCQGAADHTAAAVLARASGLRAPGVIGVQRNRIWLERIASDPQGRPRDDVVARFIETALTLPLTEGPVAALGVPHVDADGYLIANDCGIVTCLERDEREAIAALLYGLASADPKATAAAAGRATGASALNLFDVAQRACGSLAVAWSPIALGLSVHQIASYAAAHGARRHTYALFADEILNRLDLLYAHPRAVNPVASPSRLTVLLAASGHRP